jgi:hypothetical protein
MKTKIIKGLFCIFSSLWVSTTSMGAILYNGETAPYSTSSGWDSNGSAMSQKSIAPYSKPNHLRANINMSNWWGAVAYVPNNWNAVNLSTASTLKFAAKASSSVAISVQLYDANKASSAKQTVNLTTSYQMFSLPMSSLGGIDPSKVQAIVFATSKAGTAKYVVDIDNIETVEGSTPNPIPSPVPDASVRQKAYDLAMYFRNKPYFMVGNMGLDNGTALGIKTDIFYRYLVGGWRKWNSPDGAYADMIMAKADEGGAVPMFTYYVLAYNFEIKNYAILTSEQLHEYLSDVRVMYQRMGVYNKPALFHIEPDFFGYLQQYAVAQGKPAASIAAKIRYQDIPECLSLPENVGGLMDCIITMGRKLAPKVRMGFHASGWGDWYDPNVPSQIIPKAQSVANFLRSVGSDKTDFVVLETSDRDAGFLEVTRGDKGAYWDDKAFNVHMTWVNAITSTMGKPCLWWQMPFGVPSTNSGYDGHYRDNRVPYFFGNVPTAINAGGFGMAFGAGADKQTTPDTDGGQFKKAVDAYKANPKSIK